MYFIMVIFVVVS